jgi:hypothetical protein
MGGQSLRVAIAAAFGLAAACQVAPPGGADVDAERVWRALPLTAVYFFALSLELPLLYFFGVLRRVEARVKRWPSRPARWAGRGAALAAGYAVLIPFLMAIFAVHRVKLLPAAPDARLALEVEPVSFPSRDARPVQLFGWFLPRAGAKRTVLACHGVGANRADLVEILWLLNMAGFQVLAFDFRGHGESEGHTVTYGARERADVLGAWDYLLTRRDVDPEQVVALGVSMGAAALLQALPDLPGVRAAVIDSSFTDLRSMARHQYRLLPAPLAEAFGRATAWCGWVLAGVDADDVSPLRAIERVKVPLLFIHGEEDRIIPSAMSRQLHEAYGGTKKLWIHPAAGHGGTAGAGPERYKREAREWLSR